MANYSLVSNAVFQPFTYQELAAPLDRQDAYHESLMQQYEQLSDKADVLEAMGANDRDNKSGAYTKYKSYSDRLRKEADNLYQFGLNTESRQRLSDLRRMYNQEIVPIQNAWNKREEEAKMQLTAKMQNPSLMFTRDAANSSLDTYLANPTGGFGVINKATITAQMAGMAKNLAEQILRQGSNEGIDEFTFKHISKYGLDANLINAWIQNPESYPTLTNMMNQVLAANGVTVDALQGSPNAEAIFAGATNAAQMGAWEAVGKDQAQIIERFGAREALNHAHAVDMENRNFAHQVALKSMPSGDAVLAAQRAGLNGEEDMPNIPSVAVGMIPAEEYKAKNLGILNGLKAGNDAFKASYFGKTFGQVNPMKIYDEYQEELKKHTKRVVRMSPGHPGGAVETIADPAAAKRAVLEKYKKYGVTDVLSDDQYKALSSLGYSAKNNIKDYRHSSLLGDFNRTVEQRSRYSTNMADYELFNGKAIPNLRTREQYKNGVGTVWEISEKGKLGRPEKIKNLNLYSVNNTKGNKITDVQYDPEFK